MSITRRSEIRTLQARFENYVTLTASRPTAVRYARALDAFFDKFQDKRSPDEFSRADVQDFLVYRRRDGVTARSINYEITIVRAFWNWMMNQDLVAYNPAANVKRLREVDAERVTLSEAEQHRLYQTAARTGKPGDYLLVSVALTTGLRVQTMIQLEKSDVDFERGSLIIPAVKMKAGRNHEVPLRPEVLDLLRELPDGRIFEGYAASASTLCNKFNGLLKRAGMGNKRGLRLARRTFATTLLRTGADLGVVQALLAHKNISTTSRYLASADVEQTRAAVAKLPGPTPLEGTTEEGSGSLGV